MRVLITGGAGFIGSAVSRRFILNSNDQICVLDKLTYAGNLDSLAPIVGNSRYSFVRSDICDRKAVAQTLANFLPDIIMHLAAESHVDRSIDGPSAFIETNVVGTFTMLDAALEYWRGLDRMRAKSFRFIHISTDEVFGALRAEGFFREDTSYAPNSPYSASKAGSDHLARAWRETYGLPTIVTNCSNNYGPYQFPEKLIPLIVLNAIDEKPLPLYGRGENIRDWLFVDDHADALMLIARAGKIGESYNVGGRNEKPAQAVPIAISSHLWKIVPDMISDMLSIARRSSASWDGVRSRLSRRGCAKQCVGISIIPRGGRQFDRGNIAASALGASTETSHSLPFNRKSLHACRRH